MSGTQEQQGGDEAGAGDTRRSTVETSASHTFVLDRREAIPIIFVPGIMGSRLRARRSGRTVWDPDGKWFMLRTFFFAGAAKRKRLLVGQRFSPDFIEPISTGPWTATEARPAPKPVRRNKHGRRKPRGFRGTTGRGASGVLWMTYGDFLTRLYSAELVRTMWPADVDQSFYLPVYAFGYNWSASCKDAGQRLVTEARALIDAWKARGRPCRYVILVTHSMGGLVARAAVNLDGFAEQVLGVVHGVQPVTGSAEGYWRMRGGFRGEGILGAISNHVLGRRGIEVTALLGNMPGGLQLLPNKAYRVGSDPKWLKMRDPQGTLLEARPMTGDPYAEIYRERDAYWRLVDRPLLDPGGSAGRPPPSPYLGPADSPWGEYLRLLSVAEQFHDWLGLAHHPRTRSFYGSGKKHKTSATVTWQMRRDYVPRPGTAHARSRRPQLSRPVEDADLLWPSTGPHEVAHFVYRSPGVEAHIASPDGGGERASRLLRPTDPGDSTVPEGSATALPLPSMSNTPPDDPTPRPFEPGQAAFPSLEHEPAYKDKARGTGPPDFALTAIADLCRHLL